MAKKYYCGLCETSHNALKPRHQCDGCARFYCDFALRNAKAAGVTTCVYCEGELSPYFLTKPQSNLIINYPHDQTSENSFTQSSIEEDKDSIPTFVEPSIPPVEINQVDYEIISLIQDIIGKEIPFLEKEDDLKTNNGFIVKEQRIIGLNLYRYNLSRLPEKIAELVELEKLYLRSNRLTKLPDELGNLKLLKELDLGFNLLKDLPTTLGGISSLQTLLLNDNHLRKIPTSLSQLQLKKLDLQKNPCWDPQSRSKKLQRWIDNLRNGGCEVYETPIKSYYSDIELPTSAVFFLEEIEGIIGQKIPFTKTDLDIITLKRLKDFSFGFFSSSEGILALGLDNLILASLPRSIQNLNLVKIINLAQNQLEHLSQELLSLTTLQGLTLENNYIESLDSDIDNLNDLKILNLSKNKLQRLPKSLGKLRNLEILILNHNRLISLPSSLKNLKNLKILDLRGNPIWEERKERHELQKWFHQLIKQKCEIVGR